MPAGQAIAYGYGAPVGGPAAGELGVGVTAGAELAINRDGTPSRVAGILLLSAAGLAALKLAGFRFNVGVSS